MIYEKRKAQPGIAGKINGPSCIYTASLLSFRYANPDCREELDLMGL
jgi:hypothetical protein